jgi:hypothetical protein
MENLVKFLIEKYEMPEADAKAYARSMWGKSGGGETEMVRQEYLTHRRNQELAHIKGLAMKWTTYQRALEKVNAGEPLDKEEQHFYDQVRSNFKTKVKQRATSMANTPDAVSGAGPIRGKPGQVEYRREFTQGPRFVDPELEMGEVSVTPKPAESPQALMARRDAELSGQGYRSQTPPERQALVQRRDAYLTEQGHRAPTPGEQAALMARRDEELALSTPTVPHYEMPPMDMRRPVEQSGQAHTDEEFNRLLAEQWLAQNGMR